MPGDGSGAVPGRIDKKDNEPAPARRRCKKVPAPHVYCVLSWVEQHRIVGWVVDQRTEPGVIVKVDSLDDLAIGQVQARESSRGAFLMPKLLGVHEEDDPRPRLHRGLGGAQAA